MPPKSVTPSIRETAFDCPHCGAYTTQTWYELWAIGLSGQLPIPFIPDKDFLEGIRQDQNILPITKSSLIADGERWLSGSTKHDIYGTFGQPYDVRSADQGTAWFYYRIRIRMNAATLIPFLGVVFGGSDIDSTRAKFSFNSDERLTGVETEEKSNYVNQWAGIAMAVASSTGNAEQRVKAEMVRLGLPYDPNLSRKRQVDVPND
jgi:hypothetical protein